MRERLNDLFGDERIVHGPQVLYRKRENAAVGVLEPTPRPYLELGNVSEKGGSDTLLAFCPDRRVRLHSWESAAHSHAILDRYRR